jgi:hypothetical protein
MGKKNPVFINPLSVSRYDPLLEKDMVRITAWLSSICSEEPVAMS